MGGGSFEVLISWGQHGCLSGCFLANGSVASSAEVTGILEACKVALPVAVTNAGVRKKGKNVRTYYRPKLRMFTILYYLVVRARWRCIRCSCYLYNSTALLVAVLSWGIFYLNLALS